MVRKISEYYEASVLDSDWLDVIILLRSMTGRRVGMHLQILTYNMGRFRSRWKNQF
jgi:hypothetical protein